jgi:hypothetical protein
MLKLGLGSRPTKFHAARAGLVAAGVRQASSGRAGSRRRERTGPPCLEFGQQVWRRRATSNDVQRSY